MHNASNNQSIKKKKKKESFISLFRKEIKDCVPTFNFNLKLIYSLFFFNLLCLLGKKYK